MHVRIRYAGHADTLIVVDSKLSKISLLRKLIHQKLGVEPNLQQLFYGGKVLEDVYTIHDYSIKLNDVIQLIRTNSLKTTEQEVTKANDTKTNSDNAKIYQDTNSELYAVDDLVDVKDRRFGMWLEGKITRIVYDPVYLEQNRKLKSESQNNIDAKISINSKNESPKSNPSILSPKNNEKCKKTIVHYFNSGSSNTKTNVSDEKQENKECSNVQLNGDSQNNDKNTLFEVQFENENDDSNQFFKVDEIRPRARNIIDIENLKVGQKVMVNYNTEKPSEKGYWYDFKVHEIKKVRNRFELLGTVYLGADGVPQNDTVVKVHDKIFTIEKPVPLNNRSEEYNRIMKTAPEKRSAPLNCLSCLDDANKSCRECGCHDCAGKEDPDKIILCDECDHGYHLYCLNPPLQEIPDDDWYCPNCKNDSQVVAPGAAKQTKKTSTSNRDWGRGMACVGKTKTSMMPADHFGPIPGVEVGTEWRFRIQVSETGVHRPPVSGIHGRENKGAFSLVFAAGYEDDIDKGYEFIYTGSGGRDLSGNKRTSIQCCDQTLTRENRALALNCAAKPIKEEGADAGDTWQKGLPVRVVRSYKMAKQFPEFAPKEGMRYDGIYKVVKYYPETGLSGYRVYKFLLRRDDPSPAPWEPRAKKFPCIYPDGFLEAEAEKKRLKKTKEDKENRMDKKRHREDSDDEVPLKKTKSGRNTRSRKSVNSSKISDIDDSDCEKTPKTKKDKAKCEILLTEEELTVIKEDKLNQKRWEDCLGDDLTHGKLKFVERVNEMFLCIICQELVSNPVTTTCMHNFCLGCLKLAFKSTESTNCPFCRENLASFNMEINGSLQKALRTLLPGYDAGKR